MAGDAPHYRPVVRNSRDPVAGSRRRSDADAHHDRRRHTSIAAGAKPCARSPRSQSSPGRPGAAPAPQPTVIPANAGMHVIGRSAMHADTGTIAPMKSGIHRDDGSQYARHGEDARRSVALVLCRPTPRKSQLPQRSRPAANIRPLDPPQPSTSSTFARPRHHAPLDRRPRLPSATLHFLNIRRPHPLVTLHFLNVRA